MGPAAFGPLWNRDDVGIRLAEHPDRAELAELIEDSYRLIAPKRLAARLGARGPG